MMGFTVHNCDGAINIENNNDSLEGKHNILLPWSSPYSSLCFLTAHTSHSNTILLHPNKVEASRITYKPCKITFYSSILLKCQQSSEHRMESDYQCYHAVTYICVLSDNCFFLVNIVAITPNALPYFWISATTPIQDDPSLTRKFYLCWYLWKCFSVLTISECSLPVMQ